MSEQVQNAVREMAAGMSADERILIFMQGVKFAMEQIKAARANEADKHD